MNYELAKRLKDAGFTQRFTNGHYYSEDGLTFKDAQKAHRIFPKSFFEERKKGTPEEEMAISKCISIPTLSELIEACLPEIFLIQAVFGPGLEKNIAGWFIQRGAAIDHNPPWYTTLEEAVAEHWLSLNRK